MSKTLLIWLAVVLLVAVGGGAYLLQNRNDGASTSITDTASDQPTSAQSQQSDAEQNEASFATIASGGQPQQCTFTYESSEGNGSGMMYGDGAGRGRMTVEVKTEEGNTGVTHTLVTADKAYGWFERNGTKTGFAYDKASFENRESNQASSTAGTDPNKKFTMNCKPWTVEESLLSVPSDVSFTTLPATP